MNSLIFIMAERGLISDAFRTFMSWFDQVFFWLFELIMQAVFDIANLELVKNNAFSEFQDRIYLILGIYMLFKVTISLLTYLVNPDSMTDKEKGIGKLVTRSILVIFMLIMVPNVFNLLYRVQGPLLEAIPRVILATPAGDTSERAKEISKAMYSIVFQYSGGDTPGMIAMQQFDTVNEAMNHINDTTGDGSVYKYDYTPLLGTIIAAIMAFILIGICIDIATRAFKLVILRLLAPIPIISYLDPKSSKDGAFASWSKTLVSVWLDLFIKIGVLFFVLELINSIVLQGNLDWGELQGMRALMVKLIVTIGLLFFAKEGPEFVKKILGIKGDKGSGSFLSGLGRIGAAAAIGAGAIGSGIASGRASWMADTANGKNHNAGRFLKNVGAGVLGAGAGLATGTTAALGAKDHARQKAVEAMNKRNANAIAMGAAGSTLLGRTAASGVRLFTGDSAAGKGKRHIGALDDFNKSLGAVGDRVKNEMVKADWTEGEFVKNSGLYFNYKEFDANMQAAASRGDADFHVTNRRTGESVRVSMEAAQMQKGYLQKNNENDYLVQASNSSGSHADKILITQIEDAEAKAIVVEGVSDQYYPDGKFKISDRDSVKKTQDAITIASTKEKRANAKNEVNDQFSGKK